MKILRLRLVGGLGNQVFGAIAGVYLSRRLDRKLELDIWDVAQSHSDFDIRSFALPYTVLGTKRKLYGFSMFLSRARHSLIYRMGFLINRNPIPLPFFVDSGFDENLGIQSRWNRVYISGYFQDFRYLDPFETELKAAFTLSKKSSELVRLEEEVGKHNDIAIHIRRGDFLAAKSYHGCLSITWYLNVLRERFETLSTESALWIFSNDIDWCKKQFASLGEAGWKKIIFVSENDLIDPAENFYLFGLLKNQVCANSTFSLLAARLGRNENVIVPKILNINGDFKLLERSLPAHWIQIEPIWED
jgi:hypothetical protein